jgi:hypothetical protein
MRIWHGLVAVLVVALLMPVLRLGGLLGGIFLLVYGLLLCFWVALGRLCWLWPRAVRREHETFEQTVRRRADGCLNVGIFIALCVVTTAVFVSTEALVEFWVRGIYDVIRPAAIAH